MKSLISALSLFLLTCLSNLQAQTVLDKMAEHIGSSIETDYQNGEKWIAFVKGSIAPFGGVIMVDMADVAEVTEEGKDGWVTIWANATLGVDAIESLVPVSFGFYKRAYDPNTPDAPDFFLSASGNLEAPGFSILSVGIEIDSDSQPYASAIQPKAEVSIDFSANVGLSLNVIAIEIKKSVLDQKLNNYLIPGMQIGSYANNIFNIAMNPSENSWKDLLSGFPRIATPQDDPNFALTKAIYYDQLVIGEWGNVYVDVRVNDDNLYKQRVWDDNGILPPKWDWNDVESGPVNLTAGSLHTFTYQVKPTNEAERFAFWLYEKDFSVGPIDTYRIIEKIEDNNPIYALPEGTDLNGPEVQYILSEGDINSQITVAFSESINDIAFNKDLISLVGSLSGSIPFEFQLSEENKILTIIPNELFSPGESIALTLSTFIQDQNGNRMNQSYVTNFDISESSICSDQLEPNNSSNQPFALGTSTSYYNNTLCLSAEDEDWFSFSHNSNDYLFKIVGDNDLTSGDYTLQFNITADELNILTEFATEFTDTKVYLYDAQLSQLSFDDNSNGVFGWIKDYNLPTESPSVGPNIVLENASLNKSFIEPGDSYSVTGDLSNTGDESTGRAFRVKYYLSDDIYVSVDDDYLDYNIYNTLSAGITVNLTHDFSSDEDQPDGNYYLLVYVDANEEVDESSESNVFAFPIAIGDVAIPVLISPQDDAENVAKNPVFSWSAVSRAESYDFQIRVGNTQVFYEGDLQSTGVDPNYNFDYGENYKWTVRATVNGNTGDWAVLNRFEIRPYLDVPFLISPSNGTTNLNLYPTFTWDELDNADYYELEISPEADFSPDFNYRNIYSTSFTIDDNDLEENTLYYWHVRGFSDQGASAYSQAYTFTTGGSIPPGAPSILAPAIGQVLDNTTPEITWQQGSGVSQTYLLEIATDIGFSNRIYSKDQIEFREYQIPQDALEPNSFYYLRISARNSQGYGNQSSTINFTTGQSLIGPGSIKWKKSFSTLNQIGSSVPVFDYQGYLYINFSKGVGLGTIHKVDPISGETLLTIFDGEVNIEEDQEPTFSHDGRTMYFIGDATSAYYPDTDYEYLVAANTQGDILWSTDLTLFSNNWKPALDASGNIYVYGEDFSHRDNRPDQDALVSVDPNGNIRWTTKFSNQNSVNTIGNPVVAGGKVIIAREEDASGNGKIIAVNTSNGSIAWTKNMAAEEMAERDGGNPSLASNYIVYQTNEDNLYKVNLSNGANVSGWPRTFVEGIEGVSVIDENGAIFNGLDDDNTTLLGSSFSLASNGSTRWLKDFPDRFKSSSVLGNDGVWYFSSNNGVIYAVNKETGEEVWTVNLERRAFGLTIGPDGTLYVSTENLTDGYGLYAIETNSTGLNSGEWPVKHHDNQGTGNFDHSPITYEFPLPSPIISSMNITNSGFDLSWTEVDEATSYFIDISNDDFNTFLEGYENLELTETDLQVLSINEETTYNIRIKSYNSEKESIYTQLDVTTSTNSIPSGILLLSNEIAENLESGTAIGEIQINDLDANDDHIIVLTEGEGDDDNASFTISDGILVSKEPFDFETKSLYSIRIKATDNLDASIEAMFSIEISDVFEKFDQTIAFDPVPLQVFGAEDYDLGITSSSALPVNIVSHNPDVVTIEDGIMTIVNAGQTLISATNNGNEYYNPAPKVTRTVLVDKVDQSISIEELPNLFVTDEDFELSAVSSSNLAVSYQIEDTEIAEIVNTNFIQINSAGSTNIIIFQQGNSNYYPAENLTVELLIQKLGQTITVETISTISFGDDPVSILAESTSGLALDYSMISGPGEFSDNLLTITDGGIITIQISQAGNDIYNATRIEMDLNINFPPVSIALNSNLIDENSEIGSLIGTISISDPDQENGHFIELKIETLDNALFQLNELNQIISSEIFDFENNSSFEISVSATDDAGAGIKEKFTVTVMDINEAPTADDATFSIYENSAVSIQVGTVSSTDPENDDLTFSMISGNDLGAFQINESTGEITVADTVTLNYETNPLFDLTIQVSDGESTTTAMITINLSDVNEAPTMDDTVFTIDENSVNSSSVGMVLASDPEDDDLTYSIVSGNEMGAFDVGSSSGIISVLSSSPLDFETIPSFTLGVEVCDGRLSSRGEITVNLNDLDDGINEAPSISNSTFSLDENSPIGTTVGVVTATDAEGDDLIYSIVSGNEMGAFEVGSSTGIISVKISSPLDFETTPSFTLGVEVSDGKLSSRGEITVNLNDLDDGINEAPTISNSTFSLDENSPTGTTVGTISATDAEGDALTYSIVSSNEVGAFEIGSSTGIISVLSSSPLDFETTPSFTLSVEVSDGELSNRATIFVNLTNQNESPSIAGKTFSLAENSVAGTAVGTATASDPEHDDLVFSIISGNGLGAFQIDPNTGAITVVDPTALDYEANPTFELSVEVSDGELSNTGTITVNLTNQNESPSIAGNTFRLAENSVAGTAVGTVSASDPENDDLIYSMVSGNDLGAFQVDANSGAITVADATPLDFETNPTFPLVIRVSDGKLSDEATIDIQLDDLIENIAPVISDQLFTIDENSAVGTFVGLIQANDPDGNSIAYSIVGNSEVFALNASTGVLIVSAVAQLDFESNSSFSLTIEISDGELKSQGTVIVNLDDINESPSINPASFIIEENSLTSFMVGSISATDPENDQLTFTIASGNESGAFVINQSTGDLLVANATPVNYEVNTTFNLTIEISDGALVAQATISIEVTDINEAPTAIDLSASEINERESAGALIGTLSAVDEDFGESFSYSLDNSSSDFASSNDELLSNVEFDFADGATREVAITVEDKGGLTYSETFEITIIKVDILEFDEELGGLRIYPNPVSDFIQIDADNMEEVKIFDLTGKQLMTTNRHRIDVRFLPEGTYLLYIQSNGQLRKLKIIKE